MHLGCLKEGAGLIITHNHPLRVWRLLECSGLYRVSDSSRSAQVCFGSEHTSAFVCCSGSKRRRQACMVMWQLHQEPFLDSSQNGSVSLAPSHHTLISSKQRHNYYQLNNNQTLSYPVIAYSLTFEFETLANSRLNQ